MHNLHKWQADSCEAVTGQRFTVDAFFAYFSERLTFPRWFSLLMQNIIWKPESTQVTQTFVKADHLDILGFPVEHSVLRYMSRDISILYICMHSGLFHCVGLVRIHNVKESENKFDSWSVFISYPRFSVCLFLCLIICHLFIWLFLHI